ncbi:hypothetical protein OTK49_20785 [Vibrio coralliirubri]|nr:hypothetical protein [Vibrio coralliirubri]
MGTTDSIETNWSVGGDPVFAKPLPLADHSTTNMAYAGGADMGKLYLVQGGVVYVAVGSLYSRHVVGLIESTFTNKGQAEDDEPLKSYLTDETLAVAYSKEQSIITLVRHIHGNDTLQVRDIHIYNDHSSFAETKKFLKAMGDVDQLPSEEKAAKCKKLADKIFSTGKVVNWSGKVTTEITDFEPLFKDIVAESLTNFSLNMSFGDLPFEVEFNGFVVGVGSYKNDSLIYSDKVYPPQY